MIHPNYRPDIDGLRAVAVISVVLFHAFPNLIPGGFVGVDIFFVISGYLITTIISRNISTGQFSFREFYVRRIKRIFPALLCVLITFYVIGWFWLVQDDFAHFGKHLAGSAVFISNFLLLNESGYFDSAANLKPLLHLWSLAIEEQFYIFWPFLLWLIFKNRVQPIGIIAGLCIGSFLTNIYLVFSDSSSAYYFPLSRFWELFVGGLLSILSEQKSRFTTYVEQHRHTLSTIGLLLVLAGFFVINGESRFPGFLALLPVMGSALVILSGNDGLWNRSLLSNRVVVWFGLISYSLYLWHWPVFTYWGLITTERPDAVTYLALIVLSIFLAWITYRLIENPVRRTRGIKPAYFLVLALSVLGLVGLNTYQREGLSFRKINQTALNSDVKKYLSAPASALDCVIVVAGNSDRRANPSCLGRNGNQSASHLFIWGDSHAANLSYGLTKEKLDELNLNLSAATIGGCPPVLGHEPSRNPKCKEHNDKSFQAIASIKPGTVILTGYWTLYFNPRKSPALTGKEIINTIEKLKSIGVERILLVGSFPAFDFSIPRLGRKIFKPDSVNRTYESFIPSTREADRVIEGLARDAGIGYVSPLDLLCNQDGCLISTSASVFIPIAYDSSHFTYPGSDLFIQKLLDRGFFR